MKQLELFPTTHVLTCVCCEEPFTSRTIVDMCDVCYDDWCDEQDAFCYFDDGDTYEE